MVFLFIEVKVRQVFVKNAVSLVSLAQERTSQIFLSIFPSLYSEFETYHWYTNIISVGTIAFFNEGVLQHAAVFEDVEGHIYVKNKVNNWDFF